MPSVEVYRGELGRLDLETPFFWGHGGLRPGAGRKRRARFASVPHRPRPVHARRYPSHVTIAFVRGVGSLRRERLFNALRDVFLTPKPKTAFQVVQYSVQDDHVHLLVEATDREAFSRGMRSLSIRAARAVNAIFKRKGKAVRDRYHRRDLFNPKAVRRVLRYVLLNGAKHQHVGPCRLDPYSSAFSFDGWHEVDDPDWHPVARGDPSSGAVTPWTRLLAEDWRELGPISPYEAIRWAPINRDD